jgi:hypothetical protein
MGTASTAWGARIDQLLADGEWHEREHLITAGIEEVPPGIAYREGEKLRRKERSGRVAPEGRVLGSRAVSVAAGARSLVRQAIRNRIRKGTAERIGDRIRRRP